MIPVSVLKAQVAVGDGSSNAPSISFSNDTNTGLYRAGTDVLGVATGGVERMRVDAAGNFGVGTSNPRYRLHVDNGDLFINNNYIITSDADGSTTNVDYIVTNDTSIRGCTGSWKFAHDTSKTNTQLTGTSLLDCGGIYAGTAGCANYFAGNVGIGTTNPSNPLEVVSSTYAQCMVSCPIQGNPGHIVVRNSHYNNQIQIRSKYADDDNHIFTWNASSIDTLKLNGIMKLSASAVGIGLNPVMSGELSFNNNLNNKKLVLWDNNAAENIATATNFYGFGINGSTLRLQVSAAGDLFRLYGGTTQFGEINNATGFVNTFTGQHRAFPAGVLLAEPVGSDKAKWVGLIVSSTGKYVSLNRLEPVTGKSAIQPSEAVPSILLTACRQDPKVFGVISDKEDGASDMRVDAYGAFKSTAPAMMGDTRYIVNSLGEGGIWVCDAGGALVNGDYITSSSVPGYGEKQSDTVLHNYTVAKITCDCDFSNALVPKQQVKKSIGPVGSVRPEGDYALDAFGNIQWEDVLDAQGHPVMESEYDMRYVLTDGTVLAGGEAEYAVRKANGEVVYRAAFVGCTYHCG